jgi:thiopurine S-methyltransferase
MDPDFWLKRWQDNEIGFHAEDVQPALVKHWSALKLEKGARILVPLCGKSLDMVWLAEQGHHVIGSELSELAVDQFFDELGVVPGSENQNGFTIKYAGPYTIYCGDFFALDPTSARTSAAYDRAALVAMPPAMQPQYAAKLAALIPPGGQILLIGLDYNQAEMQGPPFSLPQARIRALYENTFDITLLDARDGLTKSEHLKKKGVTRLEEATYLLRRR